MCDTIIKHCDYLRLFLLSYRLRRLKCQHLISFSAGIVEEFVVVSLVAIAVHGERSGLRAPDTDVRLDEINYVDLFTLIVVGKTCNDRDLTETASDEIREVSVRVAVVCFHRSGSVYLVAVVEVTLVAPFVL